MCGIVGIHRRGSCVDQQLVRRMTERLVHRGPTDEGFHFSDEIGLGMRRLSIIDIEGGHQPVYNEDRTVAVVLNGEIYNYLELAEDLRGRGHRFSTRSDTEVIAHLYEERGPSCLEALNGMFGLAIWDLRRSQLLLARDRFGEKPLYYAEDPSGIVFSSEIKSLLLHPSISRDIDANAIGDYLTLMYVRSPRTPFTAIRKLPPAHYLLADSGGVRIERWWDLAAGIRPSSLSLADAADEIQSLLDDSVRLRLRSDVPVGVFLSGGLDSSSVCALASRHVSQPLQSYAVGFIDTQFDELGYAKTVAQTFATAHHETIVSVNDALEHLPELCWHLDEPHGDSAIVPTYLVSRFAAQELRVMLSGLGGDELFGGYPRYFDGQPAEHMYRALPVGLRRAVSRILGRLLHPRIREALEKNNLGTEARYLSRETIFPSALRGRLQNGAHREVNLQREFEQYHSSDTVNRFLYVDTLTYLPDDILHITDRMSMAASLEVRTPFLDDRLVRFAFGLPGAYKVDAWSRSTKICFKQAMSPLLPREIVQRPKWGFGAPVRSWMRRGLEQTVRTLFEESVLLEEHILEAGGTRAYLRHPLPGEDLYRPQRLWMLLMLELWARVFLQGKGDKPGFLLPQLARQ
jgi:asparagine synthase (glutamine-hydrolysing)